jgi:hypothetical protein
MATQPYHAHTLRVCSPTSDLGEKRMGMIFPRPPRPQLFEMLFRVLVIKILIHREHDDPACGARNCLICDL